MTKIITVLIAATTLAACSHRMHESRMYDGMGKYEYPPYQQECPADHRIKGWC